MSAYDEARNARNIAHNASYARYVACDDWRDAARNAHDDPDRDAVRAAYAAYEVALDADQVAHDDQVLTARAAYDARESVYAAKRAF